MKNITYGMTAIIRCISTTYFQIHENTAVAYFLDSPCIFNMEVNRNIAATALVSIGNNEQTTSSTSPTTNNTIPDRWSKLSAVVDE